MNTKDFETAIDALGCAIEIDEMIVWKGLGVHHAFGHKDNVLLKWDNFGRCFIIVGVEYSDVPSDCESYTLYDTEYYRRCTTYDLKFE